jgi:hypothetical protein
MIPLLWSIIGREREREREGGGDMYVVKQS